MKKQPLPKHIVFFDGECGLCDHMVRFIMKYDTKNQFFFTPLQGETAKIILPESYRMKLDTLFYRKDTELLRMSTAVLTILQQLEKWRFLGVFLWVPEMIRDGIYMILSVFRKNIVKTNQCMWKSVKNGQILP